MLFQKKNVFCVFLPSIFTPTLHLVDATELGTSAGNTVVSMVDRFGGLPVATALRGSGLQTKLAKVTVFQAHLVLEGLVLMVVMLGGGTTTKSPPKETRTTPPAQQQKTMRSTKNMLIRSKYGDGNVSSSPPDLWLYRNPSNFSMGECQGTHPKPGGIL